MTGFVAMHHLTGRGASERHRDRTAVLPSSTPWGTERSCGGRGVHRQGAGPLEAVGAAGGRGGMTTEVDEGGLQFRIRLGQPGRRGGRPAGTCGTTTASTSNAAERTRTPPRTPRLPRDSGRFFAVLVRRPTPTFRVEPVESRGERGPSVRVGFASPATEPPAGFRSTWRLAQVWTVEDGKIRRIEEYMERARGLGPPPALAAP